ncbi:MAG TPA: winged helix-turn-helix domain-containing protein, partial [Terriglobales bacterium]|nr:winged helix-turn-helix domain-containing protein [Terriglobales bacterium]
ELFKCGTRLKLQDRPFQILAMLLERPGEVVSREEMKSHLWPDGTFVDFDNNISSAMGKLRTALADSAVAPRYIETVGRRGYRFIAETALVSSDTQAIAEPPAGPDIIPAPPRGPWRWGRMVAAVLLTATATLAIVQWSRSRSTGRTAPPAKIMLAVLPFENLTGDTGQDYFSDGFTEEMITQLGRLDPAHLGVIARTSVMTYKNGPERLDRIARVLGVQYVLEGSVRRDANRVRITAQLIQVKDQTHLFAREYDRELKDVLVLQNEIAQEIADEIQLTLNSEKRTRPPSQMSLSPPAYQAYDLYLKGRYFWNKRSPQGFRQATQYFQLATATDPSYARAYAGLADSYALMSSYYLGPQNQLMPKARAAALKALQLNDGLAEAHTSLALISEIYDWDWQTAEKEFRRAIELDPNYATAHQWYAEFLAFQGRFPEALQESERARRLDPLSLASATDQGAILYYARQYGRAAEQLRAVLDMDGNLSRTRGLLVDVYAHQGRSDDAMKIVTSMANSFPAWALEHKAFVLALSGQQQRASEAVVKAEQATRRSHQDPVPVLATAYAVIGDKTRAFAWLDKAYEAHSNLITCLKVDPAFDPLRSDPRFQSLLRRVGLLVD